MSDIEKVLKDVVYGSVGAVAAAIEVGGNLAKTFVEKGQQAVRQGQERADELKQAMKTACEAVQNDTGIDVSCLTRAQRDELRRQLDEMDAYEAANAEHKPENGACCCETDSEDGITYEVTDDDDEPHDEA